MGDGTAEGGLSRPRTQSGRRTYLPSTGYELVAALLFQNLNAQINALVTDEDAVRARD